MDCCKKQFDLLRPCQCIKQCFCANGVLSFVFFERALALTSKTFLQSNWEAERQEKDRQWSQIEAAASRKSLHRGQQISPGSLPLPELTV